MNTLAALMQKLESSAVSREVIALCKLIDAHVANIDARLTPLEGKAPNGVKLESDGSSRYDAE